MAITASLLPTGRSGVYSGVVDDHETHEYLVETDNKYTTRYDIMNAGILPIKYQQHPENPIMTVRSIDLAQGDGPTHWIASVEYSTVPYDQQDEDDEDEVSPTDEPIRIRWTTTQFTKPLERDVDGFAILNSAGDYYDPPIEIDASRWSIVIERNLSAVPLWILEYGNTINSNAFLIQGVTIPIRAAKLSQISVSEIQFKKEIPYYTLTMRLEMATAEEEDWVINALDQGLHTLVDKVKTVAQIDNKDAKQPVLLDGNGVALVNPQPADAVFNDHNGYVEKDFSVLYT